MNSKIVKFDVKKYSSLIALIVLFIVLAFMTGGEFLTPRNFTNLTRQISTNAILAVGMTMVILTAGIDLSIGSIVALSGVVAGIVQVKLGYIDQGIFGALLSVGACLLVGTLCGAINGGLISYFKIPPFVITLGMMVVARGLALIISDAQAISPLSDEYKWLAKGFAENIFCYGIILMLFIFWIKHVKTQFKAMGFGFSFTLTTFLEFLVLAFPSYSFIADKGIPIPVIILMVIASIAIFFLKYFPYGRFVYAVGSNEEASELSGVPVRKVKWMVYTLIGFLAGVAGVVLSARLNSATPTEGNLMELDAIAAVVIGGTSLTGGSGTIIGSLIGAFLIGTLNNGMDLLDIDSNYQMVCKGIIIIFAVWADARSKR
jgi:D-xylose transport system permease protein